jgi:predicted small lipoprotein YifL
MAARNVFKRAVFALLCAATVVGCGQKGALFLPDAPRAVVVSPAATPAAEAPQATTTEPDASKREESGRTTNQN